MHFFSIAMSIPGLPLFRSGAAPLTIPKGTLVRVNLEQDLSSRTGRPGETVKFTVAAPVTLGETRVFAPGAPVKAQIVQVHASRRFGRNAAIQLRFESAWSVSQRPVPVAVDEAASRLNQDMGLSLSAYAGGTVRVGPLGFAGGLSNRGRQVLIPRNTQFMVEVVEDTVY